MKKAIGITALVFLALTAQAQTFKNTPSYKEGKQNIEKLCGCFDVNFKYAETFSPDPNYKYHDRDETSGGTELIIPVEISDSKFVLQHLLIVTDSIIIKHWREDWSYENPVLWKYKGDKFWIKEQLPAEVTKDKWTQTVWEVSDAPRYQGSSNWIHTDGKTSWENTADAPLPRREYSIRSDYNILKRTNRIVLTDSGWTHEQDNQKIIRNGNSDKLLVEEKGINAYKRIDDKSCNAAKIYWEKNKDFWTKVRQIWENYTATHSTIELKTQVNGKALHDFLFDLAKDFATGKISSQDINGKIKLSIESFFGHDEKGVAHQD